MQYVLLAISCLFLLPLQVHATVYYIDMSSPTNGNGLATTTPFWTLDAFTETARAPGDIAFVRRNTATTTGGDLNFTSSGSTNNPIIISADYDNLWNDFATSSQTYTVTQGSKTMTANASITGIAAGDWIYVAGDCGETYNSTTLNRCEYAYRARTVSGTTLTLYLPYEGNQSGAGLDLRVMPDAPVWGDAITASGSGVNFSVILSADLNWLFQGLHFRSTDVDPYQITNSRNTYLKDMVLYSDALDEIFNTSGTGLFVKVIKSMLSEGQQFFSIGTLSSGVYYFDRLYSDAGNEFGGRGLASGNGLRVFCIECEFVNVDDFHISLSPGDWVYLRSPVFDNTADTINNVFLSTQIFIGADWGSACFEEYAGRLDDNRCLSSIGAPSTDREYRIGTTTVVRPGGGATSIGIFPTTTLSNLWDVTKMPLFEYSIYTDTSSKQYDVYFNSTTTSAWTANPTAQELWIECEYLVNSSPAYRKIKKSTGTLDFTGSTAWQNLSVTCQPSVSGKLILRGYYAKPKESGKNNWFFIDGTPVIN